MEVQLSPEQAAELSRIANETGRSADVLAREAVDRYLTEEGRILTGVRAGEPQQRGAILSRHPKFGRE